MKVIYDEQQRLHYPQQYLVNGVFAANPEVPERSDALLAAAKQNGLDVIVPPDYGLDTLAKIHTVQYIEFLQNIYLRWCRIEGASNAVTPNIHPNRFHSGYPKSAVAQAGYHMADAACPITAETWISICASANTALHAAEQLLAGDTLTYALCRPPGHHAFRDMAGGFCYFNNTAAAAQQLADNKLRVAIVDVDLHHGNGTQDIFYERADVLTVSIHADPARFYPFFWGYKEETGAGKGSGYNLNMPLPRGSGDDVYLLALADALDRVKTHKPDAIVVALGLDAHESDPIAGLSITTAGFAQIAEKLAQLKLPTVLIQEGGYLSAHLAANLLSFLDGFTN